MQLLYTQFCWKKPKEEQMELFDVIGYSFIFTENMTFLPISSVLFSQYLIWGEGTILSSL